MLLNEEQRLLQQTIKEFLDEQSPVEKIRELRDHPNPAGFDTGLWQQLTELGLPAVCANEEYGGLGFGYLGLGAIMEELGRHLAASPMFASVVLAAAIIEACGNEEQKQRWLPAISSGEITVAVAIDEGHHFAPLQTALQLENGQLDGNKVFVMDAAGASHLLALARRNGNPGDADGLCWVITEKHVDGLAETRRHLMDGRSASDIEFSSCAIADNQILEGDWAQSELAIDKATIAFSAEMLGGARELLERTVAYLGEREQFGVKIGTFQALQHRCSQMVCQLELAQSALQKGLANIDYGMRDIAALASQIKCMANDCFQHISNEAVQMHGGMGITDELEIGLFLKRARVSMQMLGDSGYHKERFARLNGF